jgi:phosphopantothenoylcysteine decarboxylase
MWRHPITAKQIRVLAEDWGVNEKPVPAPEGEVGLGQGEGWFQVISVCCCLLFCIILGKY